MPPCATSMEKRGPSGSESESSPPEFREFSAAKEILQPAFLWYFRVFVKWGRRFLRTRSTLDVNNAIPQGKARRVVPASSLRGWLDLSELTWCSFPNFDSKEQSRRDNGQGLTSASPGTHKNTKPHSTMVSKSSCAKFHRIGNDRQG